jgi:hypothetical protein
MFHLAGYEPTLTLKQDDIQGIRALYGERQEKTRPSAPSPPSTNNDKKKRLCGPGFRMDTIFMTDDGSSYVFSGQDYWKLTKVTNNNNFILVVFVLRAFSKPLSALIVYLALSEAIEIPYKNMIPCSDTVQIVHFTKVFLLTTQISVI